MINRLRGKFILISSLSLFLVILLVFTLMATFNVSSMNNMLDMLADNISKTDGRFPETFDDFHLPKPDSQAIPKVLALSPRKPAFLRAISPFGLTKKVRSSD